MTGVAWRTSGTLESLTTAERDALCQRRGAASGAVRDAVAAIGQRVRRDGDAALTAMAREFDRVALDELEVPRARWQAALARLPQPVRRALERAQRAIAAVHGAFAPEPAEFETADGVVVGRRPDALSRVGVYAPGGRAAYPSSVLMGVVPARVAGVGEIIVCSPPGAHGAPSDVVLAAAEIAGAHRVFAVGGAGAVFALAHGTACIPRVDRIVGPGNAFVAEAKAQVATIVGIDSPAGPSELLVLADESADPGHVAREIIAQAEHDPDAAVAVVGPTPEWCDAMIRACAGLVGVAPRAEVIATALATRGAVLSSGDADAAIAFVNAFAAEHVLLAGDAAATWLPRLRNAGTVFSGAGASVAFGDYLTGANHVLPTSGMARVYSGLSPLDFVRWTTYQRIDRAAAARLAADTEILAVAEGLPAHAAAARHWRNP